MVGGLFLSICVGVTSHRVTRAEADEIKRRPGDYSAVQPHDDATSRLAVDFHVEEYLVGYRSLGTTKKQKKCVGSRRRKDRFVAAAYALQ